MRFSLVVGLSLLTAQVAAASEIAPGDVDYQDGAIATSLTGAPGDPANGKALMDKGSGNCIACHQISTVDLAFQGEIGPPLDGVADRWSEAEIRGIVANAKITFPDSMMPSFYKVTGFIRPGLEYTGEPIAEEDITPLLTAQEIEDVVSFLLTLKYED